MAREQEYGWNLRLAGTYGSRTGTYGSRIGVLEQESGTYGSSLIFL